MLVKSLLFTATAALSLVPSFASAGPLVTRHEDGTIELSQDHPNDKNELVTRRIWLHGFTGCTDVQKYVIETSWKQMLNMAEEIKGKVNFDEKVAVDFLGNPKHNKNKQGDIRAMIDSVASWQLGGRIDWHLKMTCHDPNRRLKLVGASFPDGCPKGAKKEDYDKCASRCWKAVKDRDGNLQRWEPGAAAYTESWKSTEVGRINFCPGFFNTKTCVDVLHTYGNYRGENKWNMVNYQCREQLMVHELFHIDANWKHHAPNVGTVMDRTFKIRDFNGNTVVRNAYGPLYTKMLARWSKDVGHYVVTNADNLAFYFLGKWISVHGGFYPSDPVPDTVPVSVDSKKKRDLHRREDVWDPIHVVDGQPQLGDAHDVAAALGVDSPEQAAEIYNFDDDELACTNLIAENEDDPNPKCADAREDIELDMSQDPLQELDEPPERIETASPSPTAAPACTHTTMTFEGVTAEAYTLPPTVNELCMCGDVMAAASTSEGENGTKYIVCQTEGHPTVSTIAPPPPAEPTKEPEKPAPDMNSPDCKACGSDLGASNCPASDRNCLEMECTTNEKCKRCNFDCVKLFD
ncbi:hypothetical protein LIA77_10747 [Sarocladium implicatum]|nr:hypothetical protein LIA77_10747 [Sarocladium implicatum]